MPLIQHSASPRVSRIDGFNVDDAEELTERETRFLILLLTRLTL